MVGIRGNRQAAFILSGSRCDVEGAADSVSDQIEDTSGN